MRALIVVALVLAGAAGCLEEDPAPTDLEVAPPVAADFPVPEQLTGFGESVSHGLARGGQGIWIHDDILYSTNGGDLEIVDVSDPAHPVDLGKLEDVGARDVDVLELDGRTYALLAGSGKGIHVVDVSDPSAPELVSTTDLPSAGVHNLAAVPGTPYVYSSGASGASRAIDVVDISDPANPAVTTFSIPATMDGVPVGSDGCHDITVRVDLERAYCAGGGGKYLQGGGETFIWDIADPTAPVWLAMIDDPRLVYHHQAFVNEDGTVLVINDEFIAPNCLRQELPVGAPVVGDAAQVPFAAAWIYDISDERDPVQKAHVQNPAGPQGGGVTRANCGSHFGDLVPGHDAFVMGWYQGGTMLVDFTDAAAPVVLDVLPADGSTWDARVHNGHVFHSSGDLQITRLV